MCNVKRARIKVIDEIIREADAAESMTRVEAIAYLQRLIDIHQQYIDMTHDDVSVTGTDAWHQYWIDKYRGMIKLINS